MLRAGLHIDLKSRKEVADDIKLKVARYFAKKKWAVHFELAIMPWGKRRTDVIAMAFNGYTVIVEVKSSPSDFRSDYKFRDYIDFCNQFYIAVNKKTYLKIKDELHSLGPDVGIMVIDHEKVELKIQKKCKVQDMDEETQLIILRRFAYRGAHFRSLRDIQRGGRLKY